MSQKKLNLVRVEPVPISELASLLLLSPLVNLSRLLPIPFADEKRGKIPVKLCKIRHGSSSKLPHPPKTCPLNQRFSGLEQGPLLDPGVTAEKTAACREHLWR